MSPSQPSRRARQVEAAWVVAVVAYSVVRVWLAHRYLRSYGIDTLTFGVIEAVSSVPYGVGTSRFVIEMMHHRYRSARWWGLLGAAGFLAPDLYVLAVGREVPDHVYIVLGTVIVVSTVSTLLGLRDQVRAARRNRQAARHDEDS